MQINNKIAVVTGASSGLGAAICAALISKGVIVYGIARNNQALEKLKSDFGNHFHPVQLDITDQLTIKNWAESTFSETHSPSILINNAGVGSFGKVDKMLSSDWLAMINTNLNGMFYITSTLIPFMKNRTESCHIINIGSILGSIGKEDGAAYCTTKFGVQGFSEALFKELRHYNIKVTCFNPGSIDTHFFKSSGIKSHSNMLQPKDLADTIIHVIETPDNMLITELTVRPLNPTPPKK